MLLSLNYERQMGFSSFGAGIARRRMGYEMDQQSRMYDQQQQDAQRQIEALQQKQHTQPQHEDPGSEVAKIC